MCFVLGTLTQDWLLSQLKGTKCAISFQEKASNKNSVSNCGLMGNFAFLYFILGIMFWAPGISAFLTAGRLPGAAFSTAALVLGAFLSSHSAETWRALYLGAGASGVPGHSGRHSLFLPKPLKGSTQNKLRIHRCHVATHSSRECAHGSLRVTLPWRDSLAQLSKNQEVSFQLPFFQPAT